MKRIFAAIKIHPTESLTEIYFSLKNGLKNEKITWVELNNIHITLKFFGETEETRIGEIVQQLALVSSRHTTFDIAIKETGIFGSHYQPRVIWLGIEGGTELKKLAGDILDSMEAIGWIKDRQNFVPHLTIGRIKFCNDRRRLNELISKYRSVELQTERVSEIILYESILRPKGPEYKILESFPLR